MTPGLVQLISPDTPIRTTSPSKWAADDDDWDTWGTWKDPQYKSKKPTWTPHHKDQWRQSSYSHQQSQHHRHATLKAAPRSQSKPLTAFSTKGPHSSWSSHDHSAADWDRRSNTGSEVPPGMVKISLKEDSTHEWINDVKFALHHRHRMQAASELQDHERPVLKKALDVDLWQASMNMIKTFDSNVPDWVAKQAVEIMGSADLLEDLSPEMLSITELPTTSTRHDLPRFQQPPPFHTATNFTWALTHGTTITGAQHILCEGFIRPANWAFRSNLAKCELPTLGAYYTILAG